MSHDDTLVLAQQIVELQVKIAFQDDQIQKLDDVLAEQQQQLLDLRKQFSIVLEELKQVQNMLSEFGPPDPPPPHY